MPELPDLQVFSRNLEKQLGGKRLKKLKVVNPKKLKTPAAKLSKILQGQVLQKVYRSGKQLFFEFSKGDTLGMHMMLKGNLYLFQQDHDRKHPIIEMHFDDGVGLVLTDFQGMAHVTLNPEPAPAPDALSPEVNYSFLKKVLSKRHTEVKKLLMDQKIIRGIGNAYADEILWVARISPLSISDKVPDQAIKALAKAIKSVLKQGEKQILKADPDRITGELRDFLVVHNPKRKTSPGGADIRTTTMISRKTYYTDEQEFYF